MDNQRINELPPDKGTYPFTSDNEQDYYSKTRENILAALPVNAGRMLELGCAMGNTLRAAKSLGRATEIVGVDINNLPVTGLDCFICGDIEQLTLPYPDGYFDTIIMADVLEHLRDPWQTLVKVSRYLKPGGYTLISMPNIRELRAITTIFFGGRFAYQECGIMDRTHLRFFCRQDMLAMVSAAGLAVEQVRFDLSPNRAIFNRLTCGMFEEFLVIQYLLLARKC
jgi:2-polyprenyl-3-methyl-5-hydroxy-6-metoxy-1,4-benzoquinol methylase